MYRIIETLSPLLKDKLMLSGEEASWRILKEALPTLEELKEKSSILFPAVEADVVSDGKCKDKVIVMSTSGVAV